MHNLIIFFCLADYSRLSVWIMFENSRKKFSKWISSWNFSWLSVLLSLFADYWYLFLMNFEDIHKIFEDSVINMAIWSATKIDRFIGEIKNTLQNFYHNCIQSRSVKELVRVLKKYNFGFLKGRWNLKAKQDRKIRTHVRKSNCLIK